LNQPRPLNDEEREKAFKRQIEGWDLKKQKAFLNLESAVKEKGSSRRMEIGDNQDKFIDFSYSQEAVDLVKQREAELLPLLNKEERKAYEQLILLVLFPERVPYEDRSLPKFDANFAKRWITKKSYDYGWSNKLFPNDHGQNEASRARPRVERIGKKYQRLALSELMARLSDNLWVIGGWPERAMIYDHPATDWFVRDIEPSLLTDPAQRQDEERWWQGIPLKLEPIEDNSLRTWPFQDEPSDTSHWMDVIAPDGTPWLLLYGFFILRDYRTEKEFSLISFRRDIFVRVSTILVEIDAVEAAISKLKGCRLADPSGHETIDWTDGPFLCEYPWRNTWKADYGIYEDGDIGNLSGIKYIRPVARHVWESDLDLSLQNGSSVYIPNPWIGEKLDLNVKLNRSGEFLGESDGQVIFIDPTLGISDSSAALIDKTKFFDFLENEGLECLWIVAGERNSWPSGQSGDYSCRSFASVYRWAEEKWIGDRWYKDDSGNPNR